MQHYLQLNRHILCSTTWNWTAIYCAAVPAIEPPYILIFDPLTRLFIFGNKRTLEMNFLSFLAWFCRSLDLEHYKHCELYVVCPQGWLDTLFHNFISPNWWQGTKGLKSSADVWLLLQLEHHLKVGVLLIVLSQKAFFSTSYISENGFSSLKNFKQIPC